MALRTPAFLDAKTYGFEWLRFLAELSLQEGVLSAGDLKASPGAAGGRTVDVAAGTALVKGDTGTPGTGLSHGLYTVVNDASIASAVTLPAADGTNPRLDQIVLRVRDSSDLGSTADDAYLDVIAGTPTAGATLDNRNGAGALPGDALRLADYLMPAGGTAVTAGNLRDRRTFARGLRARRVTSTPQNDRTGTATIDSTNLRIRAEVRPANLYRITFRAERWQNNTAGGNCTIFESIDGNLSNRVGQAFNTFPAAGTGYMLPPLIVFHTVGADASVTFDPAYAALSGALNFAAESLSPLTHTVEELVGGADLYTGTA